jgi:hypothetical protein
MGIVKLRSEKNINENTLPISDDRIRVSDVSNCRHSQLGFFSSNLGKTDLGGIKGANR